MNSEVTCFSEMNADFFFIVTAMIMSFSDKLSFEWFDKIS